MVRFVEKCVSKVVAGYSFITRITYLASSYFSFGNTEIAHLRLT